MLRIGYGRIHSNDMDDSEDESYDELDCSQQLNGMESYKIVEQENQDLLTMRSSKSTSVSVEHNGTTSTNTFLQCLFTQYLQEVVITILCLQLFLQLSLRRPLHSYTLTTISTNISKE